MEKVLVVPTKKAIAGTPVGGTVALSRQHARVLHLAGLVDYARSDMTAENTPRSKRRYARRDMRAEP